MSLPVLLTVLGTTIGATVLLSNTGPLTAAATAGPYRAPAWAVAVHLATVFPALVLGLIVLSRRKGNAAHRLLGGIWMALMLATAIVSFWIRGPTGSLSGIHLFSIATLVAVPTAWWRIRAGDVRAHRQIMVSLYIGLLVAGVFALAPDRVAGRWLWGLIS
jgi:uncharacterized membrane protein